MNFHVTFSQPALTVLNSPIVAAAIVTFSGVLITVIIGTTANFLLAKKRAKFEEGLAFQKLADEKLARAEARAISARLRRIDFQRATLVELQECMLVLVRHAGMQIRGGDAVADHDEIVRSHNGRSALLISRMENRALAEAADTIKREINGGLTATQEERTRNHDKAALQMVRFLKDVGEEIRRLDDDEANEAAP